LESLNSQRVARLVLLLCLAVAVYACYLLVQPYMEPVVLALILGMMLFPLHEQFQIKLGNRPNLAAALSCCLLTLVILLPAVLVLMAILQQGISYSLNIKAWVAEGGAQQLLANPWVVKLRTMLDQVIPTDSEHIADFSDQLMGTASTMGKTLVNASTGLLGSITNFVVQIMLMLFVLFFVLRDHDRIVGFVRHAIPLSRSQEDLLLTEVVNISRSALLGSLLTSITQGIVGGFAMWLVGFPALFWGSMMAFASLIPVVGTTLIWGPTAIYLAVTGEWGWAAFMVGWGALVVGSIDNFLRPLFMQGAAMSTLLIFFSLLGGIHLFGLMGLLYGPLIFSITLVLFKLYEQEFAQFLDSQDNS